MADQFTTAPQMREITMMLMQPNANWEQYLTPAPLSIAIMGELVFISSVQDFSINKNAPKDGYKYMKDPDSFRACLMQICNSGSHAFNEAHKNMDQLRIYTGKVPGYINTVVHTLFNGNDKVIEILLPHQLENIHEIVDDCVALADGVEKKYSDVINLIQELLEACVKAQHIYGEELENVKMKLEETKLKEQKLQNEWSKKALENMDILVEMQNCEIKEVDFKTTIKMLVKGLDAMGRVRDQWEKMVHFFQMVSNILKIHLSKTLHNFVTISEQDTKKLSYSGKLFNKDLLYNQAFQASNIASLVHMISTTYTEVSNKYPMDRVSSLGRLMTMDKEKPEFEQERLNLWKSCRDAQEGILQLVLKNKNEFQRTTDAKMEKIEGELKAVLPAAQPQETERIKEIVRGGFSEKESDYI